MSKAQTEVSDFSPTKDTVTVVRTVKLKLNTSSKKNKKIQQGIDAYQSVLSFMADRLKTYPEWSWVQQNTQMYHQAKRGLPDDDIRYKTKLSQQAKDQVLDAYNSWKSLGKPGDGPKGEFGNGSYLGLHSRSCEITSNERGYGYKASFISYDPLWFHIDAGDFQRKFLERIVDGDDATSTGSAELHLHDDGSLYAHQTVKWPVETYSVDDVETVVGVDLNDDPLTVCAAWDTVESSVEGVEFVSGGEYRHHRQRMKRVKDGAMKDDNLKSIVESRRNYRKYTDYITNVASRRVVDFACEHAPCRIQLEDLTHLRETVDDPIHDWPYAEIQEKIISKAQEEGIPVSMIDPRDTSRKCRKCKSVSELNRDGRDFQCRNCGYEVHADVNAAINIAQK